MFSQIGELIFNNEAVAKTSDFTMGLEVENRIRPRLAMKRPILG